MKNDKIIVIALLFAFITMISYEAAVANSEKVLEGYRLVDL